jgi:hypothetical protein
LADCGTEQQLLQLLLQSRAISFCLKNLNLREDFSFKTDKDSVMAIVPSGERGEGGEEEPLIRIEIGL